MRSFIEIARLEICQILRVLWVKIMMKKQGILNPFWLKFKDIKPEALRIMPTLTAGQIKKHYSKRV